jgi:hypothetical protein
MNHKVEISPSKLTQLYQVEEMTIGETASIFHCSLTTIRRRLSKYKIAVRERGPRQTCSVPPWSANIAYTVGLIATDGRHITLTSSDFELLNHFQQCLQYDWQIHVQIKPIRSYYRVQLSNTGFYNWLVEIGLMPRKSTQIGPVKVPHEYLRDFVRGCLDGDGNINVYVDNRENYKDKTYSYRRLSLRITSASHQFLEWLLGIIIQQTNARGGIYCHKSRPGQNPFWDLKFGKHDSIRILQWTYYSPDIPYLSRKFEKARLFLTNESG